MDAQIVFTGMPSPAKHMEFAFPRPTGTNQIKVSGEVWKKFIDVHENLEKPSPTWEDRRVKLRRGEAIPVFFLGDERDQLDQIGLSMMFKMAGENTTHKMMPSPDHVDENLIDLATRMFGRINKEHGSFRGRLSFGIMKQSNATGLKYPAGRQVILSSPKPSYFPAYVRQRDLRDDTHLHEEAQYRSYMNWKKADGSAGGRDTIRGWKRYPHPQELSEPMVGAGASSSTLFPLDAGATFTGTIRFHNLHPIELGALLWALEWGGKDDCFHSVGMGKPLGWGKSTVSVTKLLFNNAQPDDPEHVGTFTQAMETAIPGWKDSLQIKSLLEMARAKHGPDVIGQMVLKGFRDAKTHRKVLPDIGFFPSDLGVKHVGGENPPGIKRELSDEEKQELRETEKRIAEAAANSDVVWVRTGDIVTAIIEIDGTAFRVKGQVKRDQTMEDQSIQVFFGPNIGFRNIPRSELEIVK